MSRSIRRALAFLAKAAVSVLLLYFSLRHVDIREAWNSLRQINPAWLALAVAATAIQVYLVALRWREIVLAAGRSFSGADALRFNAIATFFNQTLPSTVGGDAARVWLFARRADDWKTAIYSVLLDRAIGLAALAALVTICLPWTFALVGDFKARLGVLAIGLGGVGGAIVFMAIRLLPRHWLDRWWPTREMNAVCALAWRLCREPRAALFVTLLSFLVHSFSVLTAWFSAQAISAAFPLAAAFALVPSVLLISAIPVSIAGWGLREGAMLAAFSYAGLQPHDGLLVSLILGAVNLIVGALSATAWIFNGESIQALEAAPEWRDQERR